MDFLLPELDLNGLNSTETNQQHASTLETGGAQKPAKTPGQCALDEFINAERLIELPQTDLIEYNVPVAPTESEEPVVKESTVQEPEVQRNNRKS